MGFITKNFSKNGLDDRRSDVKKFKTAVKIIFFPITIIVWLIKKIL